MYGLRIRELRKEKKLTQKQLANVLEVDFRTVSFWENETYEPSIKQIIKLCAFFEVSADYIIGIKDF